MVTPKLDATSTQKAYNDLRLPVMWTSDDNGTFEQDEVYIHPGLWAINQVLVKQGKKPINTQQIAEAGLKYINTPEAKRPKHPLLTKDLATRAQPVMAYDLAAIKNPQQREATRLLVETTALADVYHRLQVDPQYLEQFRTVVESGDATRIHYFFFRGRIGCIDKDTSTDKLACNPVPGGKKTPNGVWWPASWTMADFQVLSSKNYKWASPELRRKVFSPHSRIIEASKGDKDAFAYKGQWYRPAAMRSHPALALVSDMMANRLDQAAAIIGTNDAKYADVLHRQAADFRDDTALFANLVTDKRWATTDHAKLITVFMRAENYNWVGNSFGIKNGMSAVVAFNDDKLSGFLQGVVSTAADTDVALEKLWTDRGQKTPFEPGVRPIPGVRYVNLLYGAGISGGPDYDIGGFLLPNPGQYEQDIPASKLNRRIVLYGQIMATRVASQGLPVAQALFDQATIAGLQTVVKDPIGMAIFANTHEIAHRSGVKLMSDTDKALYGYMKIGGHDVSLVGGFEEGKADAIGLFNLQIYVDKGKMTNAQKRVAYYGYFGNVLRNVLAMSDGHGIGGVYHWYMLRQPKYNVRVMPR